MRSRLGSLRPQRVYRLECEYDEPALQRLLQTYDCKLLASSEFIKSELEILKEKRLEKLTNREAEQRFRTDMIIPVHTVNDFDLEDLMARQHVGLATDCPEDEEIRWNFDSEEIAQSLYKFLKMPRRSLRQAAAETRAVDEASSDYVLALDELQLEDVQEYVDIHEAAVAEMQTMDIFEKGCYEASMRRAGKAVNEKIDARMKKRTAVGLGLGALVCI